MHVAAIVALILLPFVWMMMAAVNKQHREETGVDAPSRQAMARIRRNARQKGLTQQAAYEQWLGNKQRRSRKKG